MIRKLTLVFLLFIGLQTIASAQIRDSVRIYIPPYTDTTCPGTQLKFTAIASSDTFTHVTYRWYADNVFTGITVDTFLTTALADNDSVYCWLTFTNSFGIADSSKSNTIVIHRALGIPPRVLASLIAGSNPDCAGGPLTFEAYPINGGITPHYQWFVNGSELPGEDSMRVTRIFGGSDTVVCRMVSSESMPCRTAQDTAFSIPIPIIHIHLIQNVFITSVFDSICQGGLDTFHAFASGFGNNATYQWFINTTPVLGANGFDFMTTALNDSDSVYVVLYSSDSCVLNPTDTSNIIRTRVRHVYQTHSDMFITAGANPGCLDSLVTFTTTYDSFATTPYREWRINGVIAAINTDTITRLFNRNDVVTVFLRATDATCYSRDTFSLPGEVMIRDTTPNAPVIHLLGDMLVTYSPGTLTWYHNNFPSIGGTSTIVPGATDTTYHPTMLGYYYAVANNANCPSLPSNILYISLLDVEHINKGKVNIYPNPTTGIVSMDWASTAVTMKLNVYNALGQNVIAEAINNTTHTDINLSALPNGSYYLELRDEAGQYNTYKIVLQHN